MNLLVLQRYMNTKQNTYLSNVVVSLQSVTVE